ncbi:MAG TPA: histidine phosphatase family protein [Woeseiaceae bacterium]|nr:histidine phosphatase family protein [Woeseiaceae bacterium]
MKTLTILRHGKSSWKQEGQPDFERPLSRRGEENAPLMAQRITEAGIRPSLIVSSPAVRAWSTAKLVARAIGYPLEFLHREDALYMAGLERLLDVIAAQDPGFNSIVVVGHNPGLTELANHLLPGVTDNLPTCGLVALAIDTDDWDLRTPKPVELLLHDYPKRPL